MSFRRLPFQFTTTDPVERQRELERRFGLPSSRNMFVDVANPISSGAVPKDSISSPRLQHRVPIFVEGYDHPMHSSVDSTGCTSENKKSNVRVIPIEVEGVESRPSTRHRTFSGPAGITTDQNEGFMPQRDDTSPLKRSMVDLSKPSKVKVTTGPKVHNIPIQVEGLNNSAKTPKKTTDSLKANGCTVSKPFNKVKSDKECKTKLEINKEQKTDIDEQKIGVENSLKKIENVLEELKSYDTGVQEFSGTTKDKQYKFLDEMLTRCMLKLDDVDTMGNEKVRSARKNAVKKIQACIDLLESKANSTSGVATTSVAENVVKTSEIQEICKISGGNSDDKDNSPRIQTVSEQENGIKVTENHDVEPQVLKNKQNINPETEVALSDNTTNIKKSENSETFIECQTKTESISDVPEIEMAEIKTTSTKKVEENSEALVECQAGVESSSVVPEIEMATVSSENINSEINEIQEVVMTDNCNSSQSNVDSECTVPVGKTVIENASGKLSSDINQDVEMEEVQSTLDNIKESISVENTSTSNQHENCQNDVNIIVDNVEPCQNVCK